MEKQNNYYENLSDEEIVSLLFNDKSILEEFHLINLHNYHKGLPLINHIDKLVLFKQYSRLIHEILINLPHMLKFCPVFVFYDLSNIIAFLKSHYEISELYDKKGKLIKIKIKQKWYVTNR